MSTYFVNLVWGGDFPLVTLPRWDDPGGSGAAASPSG
jgi:hypothetical protein